MDNSPFYYPLKEYARGVFLSEEFKESKDDIPTISEHGEPDIYFTEINNLYSKDWLFAMTLVSRSLQLPISSLEKSLEDVFEEEKKIAEGFIRKIPSQDNEANNEPTFVIGLTHDEKVTKKEAINDGPCSVKDEAVVLRLFHDQKRPPQWF